MLTSFHSCARIQDGKTPLDLAPTHSTVRVALANGVLLSQSSLSPQLSGQLSGMGLGLKSQGSGVGLGLKSQGSGLGLGLKSQASVNPSSPMRTGSSIPLAGAASVHPLFTA